MQFYDGRKRPITAQKALQNAKHRLKTYIVDNDVTYTLTLKKVLEYGKEVECLIIERDEPEPYSASP